MRSIIWKLLPALALAYLSTSAGSLRGSEDPEKTSSLGSACSGSISWNDLDRVWSISCSSSSTCCGFDSTRHFDGSVSIWCDCNPDSRQPDCCHLILLTYPGDPFRRATWRAVGHCAESCGDAPWLRRCRHVMKREPKGDYRGVTVSVCTE